MAERGVRVSQSTLHRWVIRFVPEYERLPRDNQGDSGATIKMRTLVGDRALRATPSDLCPPPAAAAALAVAGVVAHNLPKWPRKITLDGHAQSHLGLRLLRREDPKWKFVLVRTNRYLNNIVEQDHRAIKQRCRSMLGFKSFRTVAVTLAGIELAHRIRKRQFRFGPGYWSAWSLKQQWDRALAG